MALATKTQSQNIFAKLKAKPANKVYFLLPSFQDIPNLYLEDMLRLWRKESNMEFGPIRHLSVPRLLLEPS